MAKQFIVARGQIEDKGKVVAEQGDAFKPKSTAQEKTLLEAGVLVEVGGKRKEAAPAAPQKTMTSATSADGQGQGENSGDGTSAPETGGAQGS